MTAEADRVKAAFAGLPSLPVVQMDEATTLKVGAVVRPAEPGGPHRGFLVVGKPTEEGRQRELFAIEADRATLESLEPIGVRETKAEAEGWLGYSLPDGS